MYVTLFKWSIKAPIVFLGQNISVILKSDLQLWLFLTINICIITPMNFKFGNSCEGFYNFLEIAHTRNNIKEQDILQAKLTKVTLLAHE